MYKFHITGYAAHSKDGSYCYSSCPIDVTLYANTLADAILKAENITGKYLSTTNRKIVIEEVPEWLYLMNREVL